MSNRQKLETPDFVNYLLSFLSILVHQNGGRIVIENLSQFSGMNIALGYELDIEGDRVAIFGQVSETGEGETSPPPSNPVPPPIRPPVETRSIWGEDFSRKGRRNRPQRKQ